MGGGAAGASDGGQVASRTDAGVIDAVNDLRSDGTDGSSETAAACPGVFCEDFERGQIDLTKWTTPAIGGATLTIEAKNVAHGRYAAQFHGMASPGAPDYVYLITKSPLPALQKHNFGRAYVYLSPQRDDIDMGMIFGGTTGFPKPTYMSIANHATGWQLGFIKLSGSPTGETQTYPPGAIPVATWTCLEWEFDDDPDEMNVWGDGKLIGSLNKNSPVGYCGGACSQPATLWNGMDRGLIGSFDAFGFGFYDWHPSGRPAFDLFYDDIVLDSKRVGCLP